MGYLLVMGVCGTGKSTVGQAVATALDARFIEGDAYHSAEARARMGAGRPLTDEDRWEWLDRIAQGALSAPGPAVLACSALKQAYRDRLAARLRPMGVVYLVGPRPVLAARMAARRDHYMPESLLDSQFADLQRPFGPGVVTLDVTRDLDRVVAEATAFATNGFCASRADDVSTKGGTS